MTKYLLFRDARGYGSVILDFNQFVPDLRAALESVGYQIKDVISSMEKDSGINLSELKVYGGMTNNHWLMQMIADILDVRVLTIGIEEASALGAAYMAGLEAGILKDLDELSKLRTTTQYFEPNPNPDGFMESYEVWKSMVNKHC